MRRQPKRPRLDPTYRSEALQGGSEDSSNRCWILRNCSSEHLSSSFLRAIPRSYNFVYNLFYASPPNWEEPAFEPSWKWRHNWSSKNYKERSVTLKVHKIPKNQANQLYTYESIFLVAVMVFANLGVKMDDMGRL